MLPVSLLLVEDNTGDAYYVKRRLGTTQRIECQVDHASWLSSALTLIRNRRYDIIFLDLSLPDSHGIDTVVSIRKEAPNTPVVVLSGQEDLDIATRTLEAGADSFLVKNNDITSDELEREILYALERARRDRVAKELMRKSIERVTVDARPGSTPPPPVSGLLSEPINRLDALMADIRLFLQRNFPGASESVEMMLMQKGWYASMHQIRSVLKLDEFMHNQETKPLSFRALEAIREASEPMVDFVDPDKELLRIISSGGSDEEE